MNSLAAATVGALLLNILSVSVLAVHPRDDCLPLPCAPPPCQNYRIQTYISSSGRVCDGCPICPPSDDCATRPRCQTTACLAIFCPGATPTCGFEDNRFCRGCDRCPSCEDVRCPQPSLGCINLQTVQLENGRSCDDCEVCVDDYSTCPEISCQALPSNCQNNQRKQSPIYLNGRICLGCATCECPVVECKECEEVDPDWEPVLDGNGCQTSCPACKGPGICAVIRCGLPDAECERLTSKRGPDGEVCPCFECADTFNVCEQFDCDPLPRDCKNKPLYDLVKVNGQSCLSCPTCSRIPKCEPNACPALCVPPPGWVQPTDSYGCPNECPPCGSACATLNCVDCEENHPDWTPILDENSCVTNCPACNVDGICPLIDCMPPQPSCQKFTNVRGDKGEVCTGCLSCADDKEVCSEFSCQPLPASCINKPLHDTVEVNGRTCLSCPECGTIPLCAPMICPACVTVDDWSSPVDENGCPTQCAPCKVDPPPCPRWNRRRCQSDKYEEIRLGSQTCMGCPFGYLHRRYRSRLQ